MQEVETTRIFVPLDKALTEIESQRKELFSIHNWRDTLFKVAFLCIALIFGSHKNCFPMLCAFLILDRNHRDEEVRPSIEQLQLQAQKIKKASISLVEQGEKLKEERRRTDLEWKNIEEKQQEIQFVQKPIVDALTEISRH